MKRDPVERAARAHTNLNTFGSVVSLLEGGHLYGSESERSASQIIAVCKREMARWLREYDKAKAEAQGRQNG